MEINNGIESTSTDTTVAADTSVDSVDSNYMSEEDALSSMLSSRTQNINEGINDEADTQVVNEALDLNDIDLSFLGINNEQPQEIVETPKPQEPIQQPNQLDEIKSMLDSLKPKEEKPQMDATQAQALTELFEGFKELGLIPESFGLSQEQQGLLSKLGEINSRLEAEAKEKAAFEAHQMKLSELKSFDQKLIKSIPGYNSEFMQQVVADIHKANPEAAMKIFHNPSLLIDLWDSVGAKSQPQAQKSNVISSNGQQTTNASELEQKVMNGTATEAEEARWLAMN